jgi:hypothetical protein
VGIPDSNSALGVARVGLIDRVWYLACNSAVASYGDSSSSIVWVISNSWCVQIPVGDLALPRWVMMLAACLNFPYRLSIASAIDSKRILPVVTTVLLSTWILA